MLFKKDNNVIISPLLIIFILPCYNLLEWALLGKGIANINIELVYFSSLILAAFIEEFIFRKWLFGVLLCVLQLKIFRSMLATNTVFAAYHLCNIFSYASVTYGILQSIVAFSFGMAMSVIYRERNELVVCILAHLLVNISSVFNISKDVSGKYVLQGYQIIALCIVSFMYLFYSAKRLKSVH